MIRIIGTLCIWLAATLNAAAADSSINLKLFQGSTEFRLAPRNALVIGVPKLKDSSGFAQLKNPENDANHVASALRAAGFSVINLNEVYPPQEMTRQNIKLALYDFARILQSIGGVGLIYFSGHGVERGGQMYLAPYDAYVRFERDLDEDLVPLKLFYDALAYARNPFNLVVLDACRDNPWTQPLEAFGDPRPPASIPSSENVVVVNSTLSGKKALDGVDDLSPYASAFVNSLDTEDLRLTDFFAAVSEKLFRLRKAVPSVSLPTIQHPGGREFTFIPTTTTFNREEKIYRTGVDTGSRELLEELAWKYAGGYFYRAAKNWLDKAPLAPKSRQYSNLVQIQRPTALRFSPNAGSSIVEAVSQGTELIATRLIDGSKWVAVQADASKKVAFVKSEDIRLASLKNEKGEVTLSFNSGADGIEVLSESSAKQLNALQSQYAPLLSKVRVRGYQYSGESKTQNLLLLSRQAAAVKALHDRGYNSADIFMTTESASNAEEGDKVQLEFFGSARPATSAYKRFDARTFNSQMAVAPEVRGIPQFATKE